MTTTPAKVLNRTFAILAVGVAGFALAGCSLLGNIANGTGTNTGTDSGEGTDTDVFTIAVGDCLNDAEVEGEVSTVKAIDCAEPHDSEAYASIIMDDGDFPGDDAVASQAETGCTTEFASFVGIDLSASSLSFSYYYPTADSWANGDREILCLVYDPNGQVTGSLKGAAK